MNNLKRAVKKMLTMMDEDDIWYCRDEFAALIIEMKSLVNDMPYCPICAGSYEKEHYDDIAREITNHHRELAWKIYYALKKVEET